MFRCFATNCIYKLFCTKSDICGSSDIETWKIPKYIKLEVPIHIISKLNLTTGSILNTSSKINPTYTRVGVLQYRQSTWKRTTWAKWKQLLLKTTVSLPSNILVYLPLDVEIGDICAIFHRISWPLRRYLRAAGRLASPTHWGTAPWELTATSVCSWPASPK